MALGFLFFFFTTILRADPVDTEPGLEPRDDCETAPVPTQYFFIFFFLETVGYRADRPC